MEGGKRPPFKRQLWRREILLDLCFGRMIFPGHQGVSVSLCISAKMTQKPAGKDLNSGSYCSVTQGKCAVEKKNDMCNRIAGLAFS